MSAAIADKPATPSRQARIAAAVALAAALTVAACSSSAGGGGGTSSSAQSPTSPTSSASVASSSASASSGSGGKADAATTAAVTTAYLTFFNYKTGAAASEKYLQLGPKFAAALQEQAKTAATQKITVTVSKVELASPHIANVTFTVYGAGQALLPNNPGLAVEEDGTWKVAAQTFCALVQLQGTPPAQCQDPAVMSPSP